MTQSHEVKYMARELLANREAQPVAEVFIRGHLATVLTDDALPVGTKLYTAPPAPAVPPEKKLPELMMASYHEAIGWNACRAAMLAQPVGQGCNWIACSERLPKVGDTVLISSDGYVSVGEMNRSGSNYRYFISVATGRELTVTHWMPLPAAPEGGK